MDPIQLFNNWYQQELLLSQDKIPSACCVSTTGLDGYPNARFVSLKEVSDDGFIFTGPLTSRKGLEISASDKTAITFWWTQTQKQVRIQGRAERITGHEAQRYFSERQRDSQLVSLVSEQGQPLENIKLLDQKYREAEEKFRNAEIACPDNWGGFLVKPIRIEFMAFQPSRFHARTLFFMEQGQWKKSLLQP